MKGNKEFTLAIDKMIKKMRRFKRTEPKNAAKTYLKQFKSSFMKQGWTDSGFKRWRPNKKAVPYKRILIKTGNLYNSIKVTNVSTRGFRIVANVNYAAIHNYGLDGFPQRKFMGNSKMMNNAYRKALIIKLSNIFGVQGQLAAKSLMSRSELKEEANIDALAKSLGY